MAYTTSDLISDIKLRAFVPTSQSTFQETDLLLLADSEMQSTILPLVQSLQSEYYVVCKDYTITANQAAYDIPVRSIGMQVREVKIINSAGDIINVPQIDADRIATTITGEPEQFYLRQNQVVLYPTPSSTVSTLRIYYCLRPGKLVLTSAAGLISSINTGTNTVTLTSMPSAWSTANVFDLIRQDGGSEPLATDQTASSVSGTDITLVTTFPTSPTALRTSDYVALAGESPIPQLPAELRPVLAQATAARVRQAMRLPGSDDAMKMLERETQRATQLLTPRVSGEAKVILPAHRWL